MRAQIRIRLDSRLRALALLLTCVLGLTLVSTARSTAARKQVTHRVAVLAVSSADVAQLAHRIDSPAGLPPTTSEAAPVAGWRGFANSSRAISSSTAHTP